MNEHRPLVELRFYETYHFANIVKSVLENRFAYLRNLHDILGDDRHLALIEPYRRTSAFHRFLESVIDDVMSDEVSEIKLDIRQDRAERFKDIPSAFAVDPHPAKLPVNLALEYYEIPHDNFEDWLKGQGRTFIEAGDDDVSDYYDELRLDGTWERLLEQATREVFFVLFQNRDVLLLFNDLVAGYVKDTDEDGAGEDLAANFAKAGVLKRAAIPQWAQRAVYFRDRGLCVLCHRDLTGLVNIWSDDNFDHIVPLAAGGLNDVSNLQLLCRECNSKKRAGEPITSNHYEAWYPQDE